MGLGKKVRIALLMGLLVGRIGAAAERRLFLIHSYAPNSWTAGIREGLFRSSKLTKLPLREYYFDSDFWLKRGDGRQLKDEKLASLLREVTPDDFVIISDDEAASVTLARLPKTTRTLTLGINAVSSSPAWAAYCDGAGRRAVLFEDYPYDRALALAARRFPKSTEIYAIGSNTGTSKAMIKGLENYLKRQKRPLADQVASEDWNKWRSALKRWDQRGHLTWIFVPFGLRDSMNEEVAPQLVARWIRENIRNAKVGALALANAVDVGVGLDAKDLGAEAGQLADRMLSDEKVPCRNPSHSYKLSVNAGRSD